MKIKLHFLTYNNIQIRLDPKIYIIKTFQNTAFIKLASYSPTINPNFHIFFFCKFFSLESIESNKNFEYMDLQYSHSQTILTDKVL